MERENSNIPPAFKARKTKILSELSLPDAEYTDLSPKGSVDEGIRDLIRDINVLPGLVTTSSCAGRISVFLEGRKKQQQPQPQTLQSQEDESQSQSQSQRQFAPSGGKGAGRWLYVSHDALVQPDGQGQDQSMPLHALFGMRPGNGKPPLKKSDQALRLVRFSFEPLILHVMTATLSHAQPVLSAATSSGFRESGLQSLRCLEGDDGPSPVVAVRSAGMSLESVIGYCDNDNDNNNDNDSDEDDHEPIVRSLVSEEYLAMLVAMSNERFGVNSERRERFRGALISAFSGEDANKGKKAAQWEDPDVRKERKRAEGLARKKFLEEQKHKAAGMQTREESFDDVAGLEGEYNHT
ncbi:hypothetical protein N7474_002393 [Penicillium riverlandense]|uniref:uncharacterized protein n=1 Tax=Penicillium riverlandense TaxID=1903569 RepID=UPI00254787B9|nr:uncharacterized protein N7474_002393 [Penicillium riverlandense]KAJ5825255.1 hypothetical protein N7474_002393 [Penicillium riverlandense]